LIAFTDAKMKITKLSWAGVQIESGGQSILIDPVENFDAMEKYMGKPHYPVSSLPQHNSADLILITHLHSDHYDENAIRNLLKPDGKVVVSSRLAGKVKSNGVRVLGLELNQRYTAGTFTVIPVFAMDGIGDEQVSWIVKCKDKSLFHGGDTIWHNQFWNIAKKYAPIDISFFPINGVTVTYPFVGYAPLPASLLPEQAAVAAKILHTRLAIPMHYGMFHTPPMYTAIPEPEEEFIRACDKHNQEFSFLKDNESIHF
jgi:L-ascorbate metabolism protein UlaG (beta-lactamase superfamily)